MLCNEKLGVDDFLGLKGLRNSSHLFMQAWKIDVQNVTDDDNTGISIIRTSFFSLKNKTCSLCLPNSSCTSTDADARNFHPQTVHQNITLINKYRN